MEDRELYLGSEIDGIDRVHLDMDHLTTHAVCLGMTGSGKTGLGIVALEELARRKIPLLIIDPKRPDRSLIRHSHLLPIRRNPRLHSSKCRRQFLRP